MIRKTVPLVAMLTLLLAPPAMAQDEGMDMGMDHPMMMDNARMKGMQDAQDTRVSLGLSAPMRRTQLAMMRDHLKAVEEIVGLIAAGKFDRASSIAHQRLGLTPQMKRMCSMFGNKDFETMGIAFHNSADHLGDVLKTGDTASSLQALHATMQYCVACHQSFRQ
jgi:hypothetical protein